MKILRMVGVAAVFAACLVAYVAHERAVRDELARLRQQTTDLQSTLDRSSVRMGAGLAAVSRLGALAEAARARPAPAPDKAEGTAPAPAEPAHEHAPPPDPAETRAQYQQAFSLEPVDRDWSSSAQAKLQEAVSALMPKTSQVVSLECRTSLCRVQVRHRNLDDYRSFTQDAYLKGDTHIWNGQMFSTLVGDPTNDGVMTVAFLAREGHLLPSMAN
jgi:hypothetical protein